MKRILMIVLDVVTLNCTQILCVHGEVCCEKSAGRVFVLFRKGGTR